MTTTVPGIRYSPLNILPGQSFKSKQNIARMATPIGVIGLIVRLIGLLRYTFVVPVLADTFVNATD